MKKIAFQEHFIICFFNNKTEIQLKKYVYRTQHLNHKIQRNLFTMIIRSIYNYIQFIPNPLYRNKIQEQMSFAQRLSKIQRKCSEGSQAPQLLQSELQPIKFKNCRKLTEFQKHHSDLKSMLQYLQFEQSASLCTTPKKNTKQEVGKQSVNINKSQNNNTKQNSTNKILFQRSPEKRLKLKINRLTEDPDFFQIKKDSVLIQNLKYTKKNSKQNPQIPQNQKKSMGLGNKPRNLEKNGIPNIGNTCYINAVLQCLFHMKDFNEGLKYPCSEKNQILTKYLNLFEGVMSKYTEKPNISTLPLKKSISKICSLFINFHQEDAHQFLKELLDSIHQEINRIKTPGVYKMLEPNTSKKNLSVLAYEYWNYYRKFDDSYIYDSFCGQICNYVTCVNCKYESIGFDNFLDLSLPMIKGKDKIQDLLKQYFDTEALGDYYYCSSCKKSSKKSLKRSELWKNPNYLIIQLKRSQFGRKNSQRIKIPVRCLNLKPYLTSVQKQSRSTVYNLQGVVLHRGMIDGGHYWAQVKDGLNWYNIDDDKVEKLDRDAFTDEYENQGNCEAYIMFYKCI